MGVKVRAFSAALASLAILLASDAVAGARVHPVVPFNNPALNQYLEIIPTPSGGRPSSGISSPTSHGHKSGTGARGSGGGGGSGSGGPLAPATVRALTHAGAQGTQAVALATATAPSRARTSSSGGSAPSRKAGPPANSSAVSSQSPANSPAPPLSQIVHDVTGGSGGSGLGVALPVILILLAFGAAAVRLSRRRAAS